MEQIPGVRGSPVLRFFLLALVLAATAFGLQRITSKRVGADFRPVAAAPSPKSSGISVPFRLMPSAPVESVEIDTGREIRPDPGEMPLSGVLELDPKNPHVALVIQWRSPTAAGEHRFAKLTLEPPGQETFVHVFDAEGDIDDFLELPFPVAK